MHALADRVWVFTLKSENVGQKRLNARASVMGVTDRPNHE